MKNGKEYIESLKKYHPIIYLFGKKVEDVTKEPFFKPHISAVARTDELAKVPEYEELMTATSHLTGKKINRFTHIHQDNNDLIKKVRMMRMLGQKTGTCFQRCVGLDALNALYITTFDIDKELDTNYHERFKKFLKYVQEEDLTLVGAMTDVKGDRSKRPGEQVDPDMYIHVVDKRKDGIIVKGAKAHMTGSVNSHEIFVMPTRGMEKNEGEYALSFSIPVDTPGVTQVFGRQTNDTRRLDSDIDCGNAKYGIVGGETTMFFENVFVPWERVFMCGETKFSAELVEVFASFHRQNYGGCKVGIADTVQGAASLFAEMQGIEKTRNIKNKLTKMAALAETCWSGSLACSLEGTMHKSGACFVNPLLANVVKLNITEMTYEWMRLAQDIAGGLIITMPSEKDYNNPEVKDKFDKYFKGAEGFSAIDKFKILRYIENVAVGAGLPEALHGAGSPEAQMMLINSRVNFSIKKELAKALVGIKEDKDYKNIWS